MSARLVAEKRDPSATLDSALGAFDGFQNEGDSEIAGFHWASRSRARRAGRALLIA